LKWDEFVGEIGYHLSHHCADDPQLDVEFPLDEFLSTILSRVD